MTNHTPLEAKQGPSVSTSAGAGKGYFAISTELVALNFPVLCVFFMGFVFKGFMY